MTQQTGQSQLQEQQLSQLTDEQRQQLEEKLKNMSPEELREFQKQQCIFCQIVHGKIPSKKVYEDEHCLAVLDINPATKGHLLLLPKEHYAIMPQLPDKQIEHLFVVAKSLSQLLLRALKATGTSIFIANGLAAGQRSQHFMIHLIPRREGDGILDLQEKLIEEEMQEKAKTAVQGKLDVLLGVKREVVHVKEKREESKEQGEEEESSDKLEREEVPPPEEKEGAGKEKPKKKEKEAGGEEEEASEGEEPKEEKEEEDVSLDDIANLFK